jgi:hypothetical protein
MRSVLLARSERKKPSGEVTRHIMTIVTGIVLILTGCSSDGISVDNPDQALLYIQNNIPAVTLATAEGYNTVQLSATAYRGDGTVIPDVSVTYKSSTRSITVTGDGLVTAVSATVKAYVVSSVTYQGVTKTDTTWVTVINAASPVPLQTFSIAIDSNLAAGSNYTVTVTARDNNNFNRSSAVPVYFTISDNVAAKIDRSGTVQTILPERTVVIRAKTVYFGKEFTDSATVYVGYPWAASIYVSPKRLITGDIVLEFDPTVIHIATDGFVAFLNVWNNIPNTKPIDILFEEPEKALPSLVPGIPTGTGNIPSLLGSKENVLAAIQARRFVEPGTYRFHSDLYGSRGTIIVR